MISARTADQLADVAGQVDAAGRRAVTVPADLSDLDDDFVDAIVAESWSRYGDGVDAGLEERSVEVAALVGSDANLSVGAVVVNRHESHGVAAVQD